MIFSEHLEKQLVDGLIQALDQLPNSHVEARREIGPTLLTNLRVDAAIDLQVAGRHVTLLVETKKSVYPRDVREFLWQLRNYAAHTRSQDGVTIPVLAAQVMSPGAKEILREESAGYYDTGGSLFIPAPGLYIYIDKPPPRGLRNPVRAIFSGKRADVLHALFHRAGEWIGVHDLAELAQVSPTTASQSLIELERFEWVAVRGQGPAKERRLSNPRALLDAWAQHIQLAPIAHQRRFFVPNASVDMLAERLDAACSERRISYALTLEAAAQRYTPYLSSVSRLACRLPGTPVTEDVMATLDARVVSEGSNLLVIETPTSAEFLFRERHGHLWLASPLQVYLDLLRAGGRGKDMAEHLRRERIGV